MAKIFKINTEIKQKPISKNKQRLEMYLQIISKGKMNHKTKTKNG